MPKVKVGDKITELFLPMLDGKRFEINQLAGKRYLLSFHRFATCPFCNLRIHQLIQQADNWPQQFTVVAIFDSSLADLQATSEKHQAPFYILADQTNQYYRQFAVERSWLKTLKGGVIRLPQLCYAMFVKGYFPWKISGKLHTMPLDILVDETGVVVEVQYGQDEGDHIDITRINQFAIGVSSGTTQSV